MKDDHRKTDMEEYADQQLIGRMTRKGPDGLNAFQIKEKQGYGQQIQRRQLQERLTERFHAASPHPCGIGS